MNTDLTKNAPRSPRVKLGGYAILPRLIDKCRADLSGTIGEYHTDCPLDREFLDFAGVSYAGIRAKIAEGASDYAVLEWVNASAQNRKSPWEIDKWSDYQNHRAPEPLSELHAYFLDVLASLNKDRRDIRTWVDLLDLDDYCSFGGKA